MPGTMVSDKRREGNTDHGAGICDEGLSRMLQRDDGQRQREAKARDLAFQVFFSTSSSPRVFIQYSTLDSPAIFYRDCSFCLSVVSLGAGLWSSTPSRSSQVLWRLRVQIFSHQFRSFSAYFFFFGLSRQNQLEDD